MFTANELQFLLASVDNHPATTTQIVRNKSVMMIKLADMLDAEMKKQQEAEPPVEEKAPPKKK